MLKRTFRALLVVCVVAGTLLAAKDPFVGTWKKKLVRFGVTGERLKIRDLGRNKYTLTFNDTSDTLVADGTDQPVHAGRTRSITIVGPKVWKSVLKHNGRVVSTSTWTLTKYGNTMDIETSGKRPDGSLFDDHKEARRMEGIPSMGFAGTWVTTPKMYGSPTVWEIESYRGDGLSFVSPAEHETLKMKFDGKDCAAKGPNVPAGATSSGRRVDRRTLEMTDKINGEVMDTVQFKLSPDNSRMTLTVHMKGQTHPSTIVYERK
jgi:hypothetical protein